MRRSNWRTRGILGRLPGSSHRNRAATCEFHAIRSVRIRPRHLHCAASTSRGIARIMTSRTKLTMTAPMAMTVRKIHCFDTNYVIGSDEPYVLVAGVDLSVVPLPNVEVTVYVPWRDVDSGETHSTMPIPTFPATIPSQLV